jgi:hypothetical protein
MSVRFTQSCPTCGRRLRIRASLLGCTVACQHCQAEFVAESHVAGRTTAMQEGESCDSSSDLMDRVEQALKRANQQAAMT